MAALTACDVAQLLRDRTTRVATLDALDSAVGTIDGDVALAAAPVLYELLAADTAEVDRDIFDRIGLLLARLCAEAPNDPASVFGAAQGEDRYAAFCCSKGNVLVETFCRRSAAELTRADARSWACSHACMAPSFVRGCDKPIVAAGLEMMDYIKVFMNEHPLASP